MAGAGASSYSSWGDAGEPSQVPLAGPAPAGPASSAPAPTPLGARASSKGASMADVTSTVFTPKQVKELYKYFKQLDLNGDGHISASELYLVFKAMKLQHSPDSVNTLIRTVDNSGNDQIEFDEFVRLMEKVKYSRPGDWSALLGKLDKGVWAQVMDRAADAFGIKDEEVHKRDVHMYRQKSYFARKDVPAPPPRPDGVVVAGLKRSASKLGIGGRTPPPLQRSTDVEMDNPLDNPDVAKQVMEADKRDYTPWFMWTISFVQVAVLVGMIIFNGGFERPAINYMLGPSVQTLLFWGARYVPCMRPDTVAASLFINTCSGNVTQSDCYYQSLATLCGMGGFPTGVPNQWWRFILPIFLHIGVIDLIIMLGFQLWRGTVVERDIGSIRMCIIYMVCGVFGIAMGANFSPGSVSVAGFGTMFAVLAILYLDLFMNWPLLETPWRDWLVLTLIVFFMLAIGLLPFIDNFANVGGFVCGILVGLIIIPRISFGKWDRRFKIAALVFAVPTLIVVYFLAFYFFYRGDTINSCSWCQIIDCIPQGTTWCA